MQVLRQGAPVKLYGECGACHTVVQTDAKEARKSRGLGSKLNYVVDCPTCQYEVTCWPKLITGSGESFGERVMPLDERAQAAAIANRLLDEPNADPDDDIRVLARQFERSQEQIQRITRELTTGALLMRWARDQPGELGDPKDVEVDAWIARNGAKT